MKLKTAPPVENESEFDDLLNTFFSFSLPRVLNAKSLATELAKRTRFLRDEVVSIEMAEEEKKGKKAILGFYEAFKKYLIATLTERSLPTYIRKPLLTVCLLPVLAPITHLIASWRSNIFPIQLAFCAMSFVSFRSKIRQKRCKSLWTILPRC